MLWEDNCLAHFGIKGQKWGIRRYQNLDGTLTEAGKARIAKSGKYMEPKHRMRTNELNRRQVRGEYSEEWDQKHDDMYKGPHEPNHKARKELWDKYKDKYASATLKDLKLNDNDKARETVKSILEKLDPDYEYHANKR